MTRDKEIQKAAKEFTQDIEDWEVAEDIEDAFIKGAEWADSKPQLIPVTEQLPPVKRPYFDGKEIYVGLKESLPVVVLLDDGSYHIATLNQNYDEETGEKQGEPYWFDENRNWEGDWLRDKVTHWMPLPDVSKKENTGKNLEEIRGNEEKISPNEEGGEKTSKFYFTFGVGIDKPHRNCYHVIEAESYEAAREEMVNRFGLDWAFQYTEEQWLVSEEKYIAMRNWLTVGEWHEGYTQAELFNLKRI